jgi:hypothetical protein
MTPEDFYKLCDDLSDAISDTESYCLTPMLGVMRIMKERIFDKGQNSEDKKIGEYWNYISYKYPYDGPWKEVRLRYGRQIGYVDLELTGALRNDIKVSSPSKDEYVIEFKTPDEADKADMQEHLQGWKAGNRQKGKGFKTPKKSNWSEIYSTKPMPIFSLSKKEYEDFSDLLERSFTFKTQSALSKYR